MKMMYSTAFAILIALATTIQAQEPSAEEIAFFEKNVRPILVARCYSCHSAKAGKVKGGLYLDSKPGWMTGGDSGPAIVPGQPDRSLMIKAIRYKEEHLRMPPKHKLPPQEVATLELWVAQGAADPRMTGTAPKKTGRIIDLASARASRTFSPPTSHEPPAVKNEAWPRDDLDRFVLSKLEAEKLSPAPDEYGYYAMKDKVHMHDLHATIMHLLGVNHEKLTYRHAGRDFRLTDVYGRVVNEILA